MHLQYPVARSSTACLYIVWKTTSCYLQVCCWRVNLAFAALLWYLLVLAADEIITNKSLFSFFYTTCSVILGMRVKNLNFLLYLCQRQKHMQPLSWEIINDLYSLSLKLPLYEPQQVWASGQRMYPCILIGKLGQADPYPWQLTEHTFDKRGLTKICTDHCFNRHDAGEVKREDNL